MNVRAAEYQIDTAHSSVSFKVRHLVIGRTRGHFNDFSGVVHYKPGKPKSWKTETVINRFDYGISFSKKLDKGGMIVGKKVQITLEIEAIRKK